MTIEAGIFKESMTWCSIKYQTNQSTCNNVYKWIRS